MERSSTTIERKNLDTASPVGMVANRASWTIHGQGG